MKFSRQIGDNKVVVVCGEDLAIQVSALFDKLAELNARGRPLDHRSVIDFGWSRLTLMGDENEMVVCEPYFLGDVTKHAPRVDDSLRVALEQARLLQRLGEAGVDARYLDKIVLAKGALSARSIFLERKAVSDPGDTGWYIGAVDEKGAAIPVEDYEAIAVYQLLKLRPEVMQVLALPPGYLVVFIYDRIEIILDPQGRQR